MNPQMMADLLANLRWSAFPSNTNDFLTKMEQLYITCKANGILWKPENLIDLINQFVYNVVDVRDLKRTQLTAVQQFQLAHIILNYLSFTGSETDRQALFNSVFYSGNFQKGDVPLRILGLVTSLAVTFRKVDVLQCIAVWMSSVGMENQAVISIAIDLSRDFVTDEFPEKYNYLPQKAFSFTAVFLITIGKAYKHTPPPQRLIEQVTIWIESCPNVCFIPPHSSVFELYRWCAYSQPTASSELLLSQSRLHLALMNAIDRAGKEAPVGVIPQIFTLVQELRVKNEHAISSIGNGTAAGTKIRSSLDDGRLAQVERGVDMLFQLIQMLIAADCLDRSCEMAPIFEHCEAACLPNTEFYDMMKSIYDK